MAMCSMATPHLLLWPYLLSLSPFLILQPHHIDTLHMFMNVLSVNWTQT